MSLPIPITAQYSMNTNFPNCYILTTKRSDLFLISSPRTASQRTVQRGGIPAVSGHSFASVFDAK